MFDRIIPGILAPQCYYLGMRTAGFVLVGGRSQRMGRDKALLDWCGKPLVAHVAGVVARVTESVTLVGPVERYEHLGVPVISDLHPGLGPLGGLETALSSPFATELNLVVACDMPDLNPAGLQSLLSVATGSEALCVASQDVTGRLHPLCAVYRLACLPVIRRARMSHSLRLLDLLSSLDARYLQFPETILNVNTPEEWIQCQIQ